MSETGCDDIIPDDRTVSLTQGEYNVKCSSMLIILLRGINQGFWCHLEIGNVTLLASTPGHHS